MTAEHNGEAVFDAQQAEGEKSRVARTPSRRSLSDILLVALRLHRLPMTMAADSELQWLRELRQRMQELREKADQLLQMATNDIDSVRRASQFNLLSNTAVRTRHKRLRT